jgi:imidazolonepropionase
VIKEIIFILTFTRFSSIFKTFFLSTKLISNIGILAGLHAIDGPLRGKELANLPKVTDAWLLVEGDEIAAFGEMNTCPLVDHDSITDATGCIVLPGWCDSHTHLVFAATRENEFVDKIGGATYEEIAAKGGGILNSASRLRNTSENELFHQSLARLKQVIQYGTTSIEIKSGYGLDINSELKMLRVIRRLREETGMLIRSTFLGAHAFPLEFRSDHEGYIRIIIEEMLPAIQKDNLADYIDVFCENGFFSTQETAHILEAGQRHGLKPKIHANQLSASGGVEVGIHHNAISVDHLESMNDAAVRALAGSQTLGTMLPSAAFFLRMNYQPARTLIDNNCLVALASDYNPGSSPSGNMNFVVSLACIQLKMLPEEAINAATINGAAAMELQRITGSIQVGKKANLVITNPAPSVAFLPYDFGNNHIRNVMLNGNWVK